MKKVVSYLRVSTDYQSVDAQREAIRMYILRHNEFELVGEYSDIESGVKTLPNRNRLIEDALKKKFDIVVVFRFDRFARSLKDLIEHLELFRKCGVDFISISEDVNTSTPAGRFMFQMIGAMAEFERNIIIERVKAGMAAAKNKGKRIGRPPVRLNLEKAKELRQSGLSYAQIAKQLGNSTATVYRGLKGGGRQEGLMGEATSGLMIVD